MSEGAFASSGAGDDGKPLVAVKRRWGSSVALLDGDEARRRVLEAASTCIVRQGSANIRMGAVAEEAGIARSTLYRYFPSREELILGLLLSRIDPALEKIVAGLARPESAARSLPELILEPNSLISASDVNRALFSAESRVFVASLELNSQPLHDANARHFGPLLERWAADGQLHDDLDLTDVLHWMGAVAVGMLEPWIWQRSEDEQRAFLVRYLVRAVVRPEHW